MWLVAAPALAQPIAGSPQQGSSSTTSQGRPAPNPGGTTPPATAAPRQPTAPRQAPASSAAAEYRIGVGDVLEIAVWRNETLTRTVPVRPDGRISLPLVNDLTAAGLSPNELRDHLVASLAAYMADPVVSVIVREVNSFKVSVIGQVKTPGRINISGQTTVLDAIAEAGGFTEFASRSRVVVLRPASGGLMNRLPLDYDRVVQSGGSGNFALAPGDIVVVP